MQMNVAFFTRSTISALEQRPIWRQNWHGKSRHFSVQISQPFFYGIHIFSLAFGCFVSTFKPNCWTMHRIEPTRKTKRARNVKNSMHFFVVCMLVMCANLSHRREEENNVERQRITIKNATDFKSTEKKVHSKQHINCCIFIRFFFGFFFSSFFGKMVKNAI